MTSHQCDQHRPACGQCSRAKLCCPGYRNMQDLIFRDESSKAADRHRRGLKRHRNGADKHQDSQALNPYRHSSEESLENEPHALRFVNHRLQPRLEVQLLNQPVGDIAKAFFLTTYIIGSHFDWLPILCSSAVSGGALMASLQAVSLASLSQELRRPELMESARKHYIRAIRTTNTALVSPEKALLDDTLASVTVLSLFETLAYDGEDDGEESTDNWANHVNGSVELLKRRGMRQFQSAIGVTLFKQIASNIRVYCVQRKLRVSTEFRSLCSVAEPFLDTEDPVWRFSAIVEAFTDIRAGIRSREITDPFAIICLAKKLDDEALALTASMPTSWQYDVVQTNREDAGIFGGEYHIYKDHRIAQLWNSIRMTRLLLHEIIHSQAASASEGNSASLCDLLQDHSAGIGAQVATEICLSVGQFTGSLPCISAMFSPTVASGCALIWPLCVVGASSLSSRPLCAFAVDRLRWIGKELNIPQAVEAAKGLETGTLSQEW